MSDSIQEIWTAKQEDKLKELGKAFDNTAELYRKIALQENRIAELESALDAEHDARVRAERVAGTFGGSTAAEYNAPVEPHPLLTTES